MESFIQKRTTENRRNIRENRNKLAAIRERKSFDIKLQKFKIQDAEDEDKYKNICKITPYDPREMYNKMEIFEVHKCSVQKYDLSILRYSL